MNWEAVGSIVSAIALIIFAAGVWVAYKQLKHLRDENRRRTFAHIIELWKRTPREYKMYINTEFRFSEGDSLNALTKEQRLQVDDVLGICETIIYMAHKGLVDVNDVLENFGRAMRRYWLRTEWYIRARRREVQDPEDRPGITMYDFEQFYKKYLSRLEVAEEEQPPVSDSNS